MKNVFIHSTAIIDDGVIIGDNTKIWAYSHISKNVVIGTDCIIGEGVHIGDEVKIGNRCKIQNHSLIYKGVTIEDEVFLGPNTITTNDLYPRAIGDWTSKFRTTLFKNGCSVGANCTIICGVILDENCMVGGGSVVCTNVMKNSLVKGNPARHIKFIK